MNPLIICDYISYTGNDDDDVLYYMIDIINQKFDYLSNESPKIYFY